MLPSYQACSPFVRKDISSRRASEASEKVLGVDNAKSGICYIYICMYVLMVRMLLNRARGGLFSPKNTAI